jgi:hypothetical protein
MEKNTLPSNSNDSEADSKLCGENIVAGKFRCSDKTNGRWVCVRCGGPRDRCSLGQHGWPFVFCYDCQANVELKWVTAS